MDCGELPLPALPEEKGLTTIHNIGVSMMAKEKCWVEKHNPTYELDITICFCL